MAWFSALYGNAALKCRIENAIRNDTLSHAYIVEGPAGSGKRTFARLFAAALSCHASGDRPCMECDTCRKILAYNCADVTWVDRGKDASVKIDAIREIRKDMFLAANENDHKVYIVDDADKMTAQAQNALLIVLEEPPPHVVILLLCEDSELLLPTVRSRAPTLRMECFSPEEVREYLLQNSAEARAMRDTQKEQFAAVVGNANGVIGAALDALNPKSAERILETRKTVDALIRSVQERTSASTLYDSVFTLPTKRAELIEILSLFRLALADLILLRRAPTAPLSYYGDRDVAEELASGIGIRKLFTLYDRVGNILDDLNKNGNIAILLVSLFDDMKG